MGVVHAGTWVFQEGREMNSFVEAYDLTEEELTILVFSIFAAHPTLFWEDNTVWNSMCFECQKILIECKQEQRRL